MKKYLVQSEGEKFEMYGDTVDVNDDGHLHFIVNGACECCFCSWDYFYRVYDTPEDAKDRLEEAKKYFQGFSYKKQDFDNEIKELIMKLYEKC